MALVVAAGTDPAAVLGGLGTVVVAITGLYALLTRRRRDDRDYVWGELKWTADQLRICREGERRTIEWANQLVHTLQQAGLEVPPPPPVPPPLNGEFDERQQQRDRHRGTHRPGEGG